MGLMRCDMKHFRTLLLAAASVLASLSAVFADVAPAPGPRGEPMPNDYIPMVSYLVVGGLALLIIIAVVVLVVLLRKRRKH